MDKVKNKPRVIPVKGSKDPISDADKQIWDDFFKKIANNKDPSYFLVQEGKNWGRETAVLYLFAPDDDVWHHKMMKAVKKGDCIAHFVETKLMAISMVRTDCKKGFNPAGEEGLIVELDELVLLDPQYDDDPSYLRWLYKKHTNEPFGPFDENGYCKSAYYLSHLDSESWEGIYNFFQGRSDKLIHLF